MDIAAIGSLLGGLGQAAGGVAGLFNNQSSNPTQNQTFQQNWRNDDMRFAREQFEYQKQLNESGIRMRVADAKAAGLHPLAALGMAGMSSSPISVGSNYVPDADYNRRSDTGASLSNMGQGIGRALAATQTKEERVQTAYEMTTQRQQIASNDLDLAIKAAQLSRLTQQLGPGMPSSVSPSHVMKPNEVTPSNPDGFSAAGPATAGTQFSSGPSGSRYAVAPQGVNMDDMGSPGWLPFMYENHMLPFVRMATGFNKGSDPAAPPLSQLPAGATGWHFAFPGRWIPTYERFPNTLPYRDLTRGPNGQGWHQWRHGDRYQR